MKIVSGSVGAHTEADLLAVLVTEESLAKDPTLDELDGALGGALRKQIAHEEFTARKDSTLTLHPAGRIPCRKLVVFGLGALVKVGPVEIRSASARAAKSANADKATTLAIAIPGEGDGVTVRAAAEGVGLGAYRFTKYQTGDRRPKKSIERVTLGWHGASARPNAEQKRALAQADIVASSVNLARSLVNEPPNELTPAKLAEVAVEMAKKHGVSAKVFDMPKIRSEGMKLLEAVGRGSRNEPRFIHLTYKPDKARKGRRRVVLIGKGLTFDSGGLCIKQAAGMGDMKSDMGGAALAVGAMNAVSQLKPDIELHVLIAAAENMPDGDAYRPGDVFGSLDGKTVEIINTDAEGRLVLADALAYGRKLSPDVMIDHATLTGACMVALGTLTAGFYANDDALAEAYLQAAKTAGESLWRMPLLEELREGLKSDIADMKHTGDRYGGSITAALFLREFVGDTKWAHVDIAGPAFLDRVTALGPKGGTGFGVLAFLAWIESLAG